MGANRHMSVDSRGRYTPEATGEAMPGSEGPTGSRSHNLLSTRRASLMQEPVLVLNATYEPINVTAVRRAMVLMLKGVAQAEPAHSAAEPGSFAEEYFAAGPQHVPVLRACISQFGIDAGPRCAAVARGAFQLGKFGGLLLPVQQQQGRPYAGGGWAETVNRFIEKS